MSHVFRLISYSKISTWSTSWKYRLTNWNVKNVKKRPNFLSQWEQSKDFTPYFLCLYVFKFHKILLKKDEFLITMRAIKSFDTILCVFMCSIFRKFCHKKAKFLITMRAIKSFDTIIIFLFLHVFKFQKTLSKKDEFFYHNESNKKFWYHTFCVFIGSNFRNFSHKKGRISYHNESNQKFRLSLQLHQTD